MNGTCTHCGTETDVNDEGKCTNCSAAGGDHGGSDDKTPADDNTPPT